MPTSSHMEDGGMHSLLLRIGCGALIGDPFAVEAFGRCFSMSVSAWNLAHPRLMGGVDGTAFFTECPVPVLKDGHRWEAKEEEAREEVVERPVAREGHEDEE